MGGAGGSPGCCVASRTAPPPGQRLASAAPPDRHTETCQLHTAHTPGHLIRNNQPARTKLTDVTVCDTCSANQSSSGDSGRPGRTATPEHNSSDCVEMEG